MVRAPETVLWTRSLCTMQWIFVTIVTTIVIAIAQPIRFDANIRFFAFQMIRWTRRVLWTAFVCLIGCAIIFAIVDAITDLSLWYASTVQTGEFTIDTWRIRTAFFVGTIFAVVLMITFPRFEDAAAVVAAELVWRTRMECTIVRIFIAVITAIVVTIASPHTGNAAQCCC